MKINLFKFILLTYMDKKVLITDYFKPIKQKNKLPIRGYNIDTEEWHCINCGVNMGKHNPRQYCRKYYCENNLFYTLEDLK